MENITIGNIDTTLKFIIELVGAIVTIYFAVKKAVDKAFEPVNTRIDQMEHTMNKRMDDVELQAIKNFLVQELTEIKRDAYPIDEMTKKRFFEEYDAYISKGQNSYIKHEVEECQKKGLL